MVQNVFGYAKLALNKTENGPFVDIVFKTGCKRICVLLCKWNIKRKIKPVLGHGICRPLITQGNGGIDSKSN